LSASTELFILNFSGIDNSKTGTLLPAGAWLNQRRNADQREENRMTQTGEGFSGKHGDTAALNPDIEKEILGHARRREIACAVAFTIVENLHVAPAEVGKAVDLMNFRLIKCQLGLFGYQPSKKIVTPSDRVPDSLRHAIESACIENRVSCREIWQIAARFRLRKMAVSSACETLGIKIKPCQLGAF
jgi:hypothetical protein